MKKYFDKIYVITSSKYSPGRKSAVAEELRSSGFYNFEYVEAVWGQDFEEDMSPMVSDGVLAKEFIDPNGMLTRNIVACAMSHKKAYEKMLEDGYERALILEDDIMFSYGGLKGLLTGDMDRMQSMLSEFDWDVLFWGWVDHLIPSLDIGKHPLYGFRRYHPEWSAHAYQISRSGAQKLLLNNTPVKYAADVNIECCANLNVFTTRYSFITQRFGKHPRPDAHMMMDDFYNKIIQNSELFRDTYEPQTVMPSSELSNMEEVWEGMRENRAVSHTYNQLRSQVEGTLPVSSLSWQDYTDERGVTHKKWLTIRFNG